MLENCPSNTTLYLPANSSELNVSWPFPTASDNSGCPVTVYNATYTEVEIESWGVLSVTVYWSNGDITEIEFHIGHYLCIIRAEDEVGNVAECVSHIWIIGKYC